MKRFGLALAAIAALTVVGHGAVHHHDRHDGGTCALCASPAPVAPGTVEFTAPVAPAVAAGIRPFDAVTARPAPRFALPRSPPLA